MEHDINLLATKKVAGESKFPIYIRFTAIGLLSIVAFLGIVFFILKAQSALPVLQQQEQQLLTSLSNQNEKIGKYMFVTDRLTSVDRIINTRFKIDKPMGIFQKSFTPGITLDQLSFDKENFSFTVGSNSLGAVNRYMQNFETTTIKDAIFKKVTLDSITYDDKNKRYTVTIRGLFNEKN